MATLLLRSNTYLIRFSRREDGKIIQRTFSLGTGDKKVAQRMRLEYEELYDAGQIDPFDSWSPMQDEKKKKEAIRNAHLNLQEAIDRFLEERTQANAVTKKGYAKVLNMLVVKLGRSLPIASLKSQDIRDICFQANLAVATQRSYLVHLKAFCKWMYDHELLRTNLTKGIKPPKPVDRVVEKVIDENQLRRLFEVFDQHIEANTKAGFIKHANQRMEWFKPMMSTFFYAGLRSKELIHLRWKDIQDDFRFILVANNHEVTTKSGKARKVPIRPPLAVTLRAWHAHTDPQPDDYVFSQVLGYTGKQKMDPFRITNAFKRFARMAGLPKDCNIHGLRHSFGTDLLRKGVPINRVSEMMGHSTIEVTKIYQHLTPEDLYDSVKAIDEMHN